MTIKKKGGKFVIVSKKTGKQLGKPYATREAALKRLREIEFFKNQKK